ncbi:MAG: hypothetical protein EAZ27_11780 [Cytophagales bacterium]|nr:MAG: hypothetical protein EAZ27_11780 [Cytophagales bacterium]
MVFTFQSDIVGDAFDEVRLKLKISQIKVRKSNTDFLMYELLEATIVSYFKIIEEFGEKIEELETSVMSKPDTTILRKIYKLRRSTVQTNLKLLIN